MTCYYEVHSSSKPHGEGEQLEPSRYSSREDAERAAQRESGLGFFAQVWMCTISHVGCLEQYCCEYAAKEVAA